MWVNILFGCGCSPEYALPNTKTGVRGTDSRFSIGLILFGCGCSFPQYKNESPWLPRRNFQIASPAVLRSFSPNRKTRVCATDSRFSIGLILFGCGHNFIRVWAKDSRFLTNRKTGVRGHTRINHPYKFLERNVPGSPHQILAMILSRILVRNLMGERGRNPVGKVGSWVGG